MTKEQKERETLHLRIKPELKERATAAAEKKGLDLSSYVRMVLTEAVERDSK
jgi:antitoxin component of RelBE/YafQ-DinJ toxin-antitoxin module